MESKINKQLQSVSLYDELSNVKLQQNIEKIQVKNLPAKAVVIRKKIYTNYFIYYAANGKLQEVNKNEFTQAQGSCIAFKQYKIKCVGGIRIQNMIVLQKVFAESLWSVITGAYRATSNLVSVVSRVGSRINDPESMLILAEITSIMLQHSSGTYNNWTPMYLCGFLIRIFALFKRINLLIAESFDGALLTLSLIGLPAKLLEVLKTMNLLTNKKISDHANVFLDLIGNISEFIVSLLNNNSWIPNYISLPLQNLFQLGKRQYFMSKIKKLVCKWDEERKCIADDEFRKEVKILKKLKENDVYLNDKILSNLNTSVISKFNRLCISVDAYEKCSRREPVCVIFEGPPGTGKTVLSVNLLESMKREFYSHIVNSSEGKDFYDTYNNESIFVMDDVGQMGMFQWKNVINMVSTLKLPLDCAAVDLKDTKFFDSKLMLLTTNKFSQIHGLTKGDGIDSVEALWRRGHVFSVTKNRTYYKRYDPFNNSWIYEWPEGFTKNYPLTFSRKNRLKHLAWIKLVVEELERTNDRNYSDITLTKSQLEVVTKYEEELEDENMQSAVTSEDELEPENYKVIADVVTQSYDVVVDYLGYWISSLTTLTQDLVAKMQEHLDLKTLTIVSSMLGLGVILYNMLKKDSDNTDKTATEEWKEAMLGKKAKIVEGVAILAEAEEENTLISKVKESLMICEIYSDDEKRLCHCLVSGHKLFLPYHVVGKGRIKCNVYKNDEQFEKNNRLLDLVSCNILMQDKENDYMILEFDKNILSPFKNMSKFFKPKIDVPLKSLNFVTSVGIMSLDNRVYFTNREANYTLDDDTYNTKRNVWYNITSKGLCGSLIVDNTYGVVGMHIAGNGTFGISNIYSQKVMSRIYTELSKNDDMALSDAQMLEPNQNNYSGMIVKTDKVHVAPKQTKLFESPLHGIFPITKVPAELSVMGKDTLKIRSERTQVVMKKIPTKELDFIKQYFETLIPVFSPITEREVILGNDVLSKLNKDSVSGYNYPMNKEEYIDYVNGIPTLCFSKELEKFRTSILSGKVDLNQILQYYTLKDELRTTEKAKKPRTFAVDSLVIQFETKRLLGEIMMETIKNRWFTGIAIGVNPYTDWDKIYDKLKRCEKTWDGDVGEWDASVSCEIQDLLNEIILKKFVGNNNDKKILEFILSVVVRSWVLATNELRFKTHGVLSGSWITNLFNSIYNRGYSAGWYCRECMLQNIKPNINEFVIEFVDFVQGDDKLCGVNKNMRPNLTGKSMSNYFYSVGMTFTDGKKKKLEVDTMPLEELSFLKRTFRRHKELGIVGPLSKETLKNMIMWLPSDKDSNQVMHDKLNVYQREMYLHNEYEEEIKYIENKCKEKRVPFFKLPNNYLKYLYVNEPDVTYEYVKRILDKNY